MKRNDKNNLQGNGYPQQNGYAPEGYQGQAPYQGYPAGQGYPSQPAYPQQGGYAQPQQGYAQPQGYNAAGRNYQTPQVTGNQASVNPQENPASYTGQGSFAQGGYPQQGYAQPQAGYQAPGYSQQAGYPQQNPAGAQTGYTYPGSSAPAGSYIPQTPYSQGYTSPGYQAPSNGYAQGYSAYNQMGRTQQQQAPYYPQQDGGQVPLNGGGYVPQPVPVRRKPFVMTDAHLLIASAVLLALFALGMFAPGLGILKWVFIALALGTIAFLWIKPMVDSNKRLCYTIVFGLLVLVTVIGFVTSGLGGQTDPTRKADPANTGAGQPGAYTAAPPAQVTPSVTSTPEPDLTSVVTERLKTFFYYWSGNRQDDMLTLCSPTWASKQENPKTALFGLMANRTPKDYEEENISGTPNDTNRTVTITSLMDRNNGKDPVRYRLSVIMVKENDGLWYVDPQSLQTYEDAETPDPSITNTPVPTPTPATNADTVLYYNPSGGEYYHRDQNCKRINERYLPLQGHFKYSELSKFPKLKPCAICGAPSR